MGRAARPVGDHARACRCPARSPSAGSSGEVPSSCQSGMPDGARDQVMERDVEACPRGPVATDGRVHGARRHVTARRGPPRCPSGRDRPDRGRPRRPAAAARPRRCPRSRRSRPRGTPRPRPRAPSSSASTMTVVAVRGSSSRAMRNGSRNGSESVRVETRRLTLTADRPAPRAGRPAAARPRSGPGRRSRRPVSAATRAISARASARGGGRC